MTTLLQRNSALSYKPYDFSLDSYLAKKYSNLSKSITFNLVIHSCFRALHDRGSLLKKTAYENSHRPRPFWSMFLNTSLDINLINTTGLFKDCATVSFQRNSEGNKAKLETQHVNQCQARMMYHHLSGCKVTAGSFLNWPLQKIP